VFLAKIVERISVSMENHIWVVVKEQSERLLKLKCNQTKMSVIMNTPLFFESYVNNELYKQGEKLKIIYVGIVQYFRGIDLIINGINLLPESIKCLVEFHIVGSGEDIDNLKELSKKFNLQKNVIFHGWLEHSNAMECVKRSHIGVIPHKVVEHTQTTLPNKIFDFMMYGKAVVTTNIAPLKKIIDEEKVGFVLLNNSTEDFCVVIQLIVNNPALLLEMGKNGIRAYREKFNWNVDVKKIDKCLFDLV
jgi:glycosyltransferase involved in cell wall biosynthesis